MPPLYVGRDPLGNFLFQRRVRGFKAIAFGFCLTEVRQPLATRKNGEGQVDAGKPICPGDVQLTEKHPVEDSMPR